MNALDGLTSILAARISRWSAEWSALVVVSVRKTPVLRSVSCNHDLSALTCENRPINCFNVPKNGLHSVIRKATFRNVFQDQLSNISCSLVTCRSKSDTERDFISVKDVGGQRMCQHEPLLSSVFVECGLRLDRPGKVLSPFRPSVSLSAGSNALLGLSR